MTKQEHNKELIRAVFEAIDAGDLAHLDEHPGYQQIGEIMPLVKTAFPDLRHTIREQIAEGDLVATFSIVTATHLGEFQGIAPTGRKVSFQHLDMDRLLDGKVITHNAESGWLGVLLDWGVLPLRQRG